MMLHLITLDICIQAAFDVNGENMAPSSTVLVRPDLEGYGSMSYEVVTYPSAA